MLKGKKILLAICGSISFYKSFELLSMLKKAGASVKVALSDGVLNFVNPEPFEALSGHKVLSSKTQNWLDGINHIEYGKCDIVVIAPASVNTINKLANGVCDNIFMQTLVATKAPIIIAPAANERMLMNFATLNSLKILIHNGVKITNPQIKKLACGEIANGGLAEVMDIYLEICKAFYKDKFFENKTVVVTAGATTEKIDDVRAVTNLSSGKTGKALADAYFLLGANVVFISSINFEVPYKFIKFDTSIGLKTALKSQNLKSGDIVVMAAAVSDYLPVRVKER